MYGVECVTSSTVSSYTSFIYKYGIMIVYYVLLSSMQTFTFSVILVNSLVLGRLQKMSHSSPFQAQ